MDLYFRTKDNGATVFRLEESSRQQRLDINPIAEANVRNGEIKPRKGVDISPGERAEIEAWIAKRRTVLAAREAEGMRALIDSLNSAANWYSSRPDPELGQELAPNLFMAMHDLRNAMVRFQSKERGD